MLRAMTELEWRPVVGWEGLYEVSEVGDVRRVNRNRGPLKPSKRRVHLCRDGRPKFVRIDDIYEAAFPNHPPLQRPPRKPYSLSPRRLTKLTEPQVLRIRDELASGMSQVHIATRYGISPESVRCIKQRLTWKHLPDAASSTTVTSKGTRV